VITAGEGERHTQAALAGDDTLHGDRGGNDSWPEEAAPTTLEGERKTSDAADLLTPTRARSKCDSLNEYGKRQGGD